MTAREALRLGTRGGAAVLAPRRHRLARARASAPTSPSGATTGLELGGADDLVAGLVFAGPHRVDRLVVGGEDVVRDGALVRADEAEIARAHRVQARRFARMSGSLSTHVLDTAAGRPAAGVAVELLRDGADRRVSARPTPTAGRASPTSLEPGRTASSSIRRRRSSRRVELEVELDGRPLPRPAPRLPVLVRELPRQLSADELAELFEGRTRFVERLAARADPLVRARTLVIDELPDDEKREVLDAHPAIGQRTGSRPARRPSRARTTTRTCWPSSRA